MPNSSLPHTGDESLVHEGGGVGKSEESEELTIGEGGVGESGVPDGVRETIKEFSDINANLKQKYRAVESAADIPR